jgi:hypothetical protein
MNPSTEVRNAVLRLYETMATGDASAIRHLFSRQSGVLAIGSDPSEWWAGHDTIVEAFQAQLRGIGRRKVEPGDLNAFVEGTVGWAADRRTHRQTNGQELTVRETFLFHQEDGEWKLVQLDASAAMPNAELAGQDPAKERADEHARTFCTVTRCDRGPGLVGSQVHRVQVGDGAGCLYGHRRRTWNAR